MIRKPCVCYSCTEHREAPRSNDPWVNLIRDMIRDGRLKHIGVAENGKNMYQANWQQKIPSLCLVEHATCRDTGLITSLGTGDVRLTRLERLAVNKHETVPCGVRSRSLVVQVRL